jgi:uncharacterized membrane protein
MSQPDSEERWVAMPVGQVTPIVIAQEQLDILSRSPEILDCDSKTEVSGDRELTFSQTVEVALTEQPISAKVLDSGDRVVNNGGIDACLLQEQQLEQWLSTLLKYGVFFASSFVFTGGILYLIRHGEDPVSYQVFRGEPSMFRSPVGVVKAVLSGCRLGLVQLGLLFLIATPILRVIFSFGVFLWRRDFTYASVTLLVMVGLIYSFVGAYF